MRAAVLRAAGAGATVAATALQAAAGRLSRPALAGGSALAETLLVLGLAVPLTWLAVTWTPRRTGGGTPGAD